MNSPMSSSIDNSPQSSPACKGRLWFLAREIQRRIRLRKLESYRPYTNRAEFHAAGAAHRERLFMAGSLRPGLMILHGCSIATWIDGKRCVIDMVRARSSQSTPSRALNGGTIERQQIIR